MSKSIGKKIGVKFDVPLTYLKETPVEGYPEEIVKEGTLTASYSYSSYTPDRLYDGSTSTYWRTSSSGAHLIISHLAPKILVGVRFYLSSYLINNFSIYGSNDNDNWDHIYDSPYNYSSGWREFRFDNTNAYLYYKVLITDGGSNRTYVYEMELIHVGYGDEPAWKVSWQEKKFVGGPILDMEVGIYSIIAHPTEDRSILLEVDNLDRFKNAIGNITVSYDSTKGTMTGQGGKVENFSVAFTPDQLVEVPNPHADEIITLSCDVSLDITKVFYKNRFENEQITLGFSASINIIEASVINP